MSVFAEAVYAPVDGQCPRCGREVRPTVVLCEVCCLRLGDGEDVAAHQTALLRPAWEDEHPRRMAQWEAWKANPSAGPPPGLSGPPLVERWEMKDSGLLVRGPYRPLERLTTTTVVGLGLMVLLTVASVLSFVIEYRAVSDQGIAAYYDDDLGLTAALASGGLYLIALLFTSVAFMIWLNRAYKNVDAFAPGCRSHRTGWAIGAWFVPFMNLVRPYRIVKESWWAVARRDQRNSGPAWLRWWWGTWLVWLILNRIAGQQYMRANDAPEILRALETSIAVSLFSLVPAVLAIVAVVRIGRATGRRHAEEGMATAR